MPRKHVIASLGSMTANSLQLLSLMVVTSGAGLTMLFAGMKKRQLSWRTLPRERRTRHRR